MDLGLKDKRAFVAGSSRGLGFAVAARLAAEGCDVALNARDEAKVRAAADKLAKESGRKIPAIAGDVTDAAAPERVVSEAVKALGGLDLLVTNAGGPPSGSFESFDEVAWQKAIDTCFMNHVRLIRAALPHLRKSSAASVLTMTSYTAKQPLANLVLSNSIRMGTVGLTKSLALELGGDGIRFNSILPATIDTDRVRELAEYRAKKNGTTLAEEQARDAAKSVLGRIGKPEEFANAAVFLLSPAASYITGLMMTVDGGQYKGTL